MVDPGTSDKSRQKSCNACVRSKRRCDKRTPQCTRCAAKGLSCLYLPAASGPSNVNIPRPRDVNAEGLFTAPGQPSIVSAAEGGFDHFSPQEDPFASSAANADNSQMSLVGPTVSFDLPFLDFDNFTNYMAFTAQNSGTQPWHTQPIQNPTSLATVSRMSSLPRHASHQFPVDDISENFQPWRLYQSDSKIRFMTKAIKDIPRVFARTTETPFLHRHLYRKTTPRSMVTLYAAVSVYVTHNDSNRDWALRVLTQGVDDLMAVHKEAASHSRCHGARQSHEPTTNPAAHAQDQGLTGMGTGVENALYEKLASTQALWMYQVVRVFDGDIGLRAQAERDMATLESWLLELENYRDNLTEMCLLDEAEVRGRAPKSWASWIMNESLRRTILMGYSFIAFYGLLKWSGCKDADMPDPGHFVRVHRWTASGALWRADSSPAFFLAWHRERQTFVPNFFIGEFARVAKPVDIDPLSWIMLAAFVGVAEMEQFMVGDGTSPIHPATTSSK
ncbi:hypothetical protein BDV26DRAFT_294130 [Aspergillus bertholletiae]|uniref:Zn(2)-C6 fungal-type domain-containing protein n=1 Tax=Aspergillus bertholletiae TaxID=1226010 RepID=A0A5N7B2R3_9EURO|nr:hypothetical protein BDV26DRAFT_294130 [Aspergillus bertholletiae]